VGGVISGGVSAFFILAEVTWPWAPTKRAMFGSSFFWKLGYDPPAVAKQPLSHDSLKLEPQS